MLKKGDRAVIRCPNSKYDNVEWLDVSDMSELRNTQVHALASYAVDGSCWEWVVMHSKGPAYIQSGEGR